MPSSNGGNINFNVNMTVNKNGLNDILKPLQQIQKQLESASTEQLKNGFDRAAQSAKQLESIINSSWNDKLGQLNLDKFNQSIKNSYGDISQLKNSLVGAGTAGQSAFNALASQILNSNLQLRESNKLLDSLATSMANTVKWGITSSIFNNITGAIQKAYYYSKDLDTSLNNIRIVTGDSADQMDRFAKIANSAAKDLGRSTLDYTNAALSFYQQGLNDEQVAARTQTTLKAQNITGVGTEMVDYLTAVWNGFDVKTAEQTEEYVDKLAKVADISASDMSQLAIAMSKVASTANTMGVNVDQLTAQLATVIAVTRQAPESVGTAFKTIYSRLNDIKTGADDAEISLGNYSGKMAELGFNVLDANGRLRETGQVMEQIGSRWSTLSKQQQVYLAQTAGGMRQVNQVITLFDNWAMYSDMLNASLSAQGTLNEKNSIYLESTNAQLQTLATETERTYNILFDQDVVQGFSNIFTDALELFNNYIEGIGGGAKVFLDFGTIVAGVFNKQISESILQAKRNLELTFSKRAVQQMQSDFANQIMADRVGSQAYDTVQQEAVAKAAEKQASIYREIYAVRQGLNDEALKELNIIQKQIGANTAKLESIRNYKSLLDQAGYSESLSTAQIQAAVATRQEQNQKIQTSISYLERYAADDEALTQEQQKHVLNWEQIKNNIVGTSNEAREFVNIHKENAPNQNEINIFLQQQKQKLQQGKTKLQEINEALKARVAIEKGEDIELEKQNQALEKSKNLRLDQAKSIINLQNAVKGFSAIGQVFTGLSGLVKTFSDETATAEQKFNSMVSTAQTGLMAIGTMFGPVGMGIATLANGIISLSSQIPIVKNFFEDWLKTTDERIEELNQKINNTYSQLSSDNKNISSLKQIQEEWDTLSKKAGDYGKNLKNMTKEDQQRYHELVDTFTEYNEAVILGYDAQGQKIIANRGQLQQTIKLLEQQKRMQVMQNLGDINQVLSSEDTRAAEPYQQLKTLQTEKENSQKALENAQQSEKIWLQHYANQEQAAIQLQSEIVNRINSALNQFTFYGSFSEKDINTSYDLSQAIQKKLRQQYGWTEDANQWIAQVSQNIDPQNIEENARKFTQYQNVLFQFLNDANWSTYDDNYDINDTMSFGSMALIETILGTYVTQSDQINDTLQVLETQMEQAAEKAKNSKLNTGLIMTIMQNYTGYTNEWDALRTDKNQGFVRQLILNYLDQFVYDPDAVSDKEQQVVNSAQDLLQFGREYAAELNEVFDAIDTVLQTELEKQDFGSFEGTVKQRFDKALEIANRVISNLNPKEFENAEARQALANILAQSLDLSNLKINVNTDGLVLDTSQAEKKVDQELIKLREIFINKARELGGIKNFNIDWIKNIFNEQEKSNFEQTLDNLNWGHFLLYLNQGQDGFSALNKIVEESRNNLQDLNQVSQNLDFDTVFNTDSVIKHLQASKKLTDQENQYLYTLEQADSKLGQLAIRETRNSDNYIARLKEIESLGQDIYKDRLENEKTYLQKQIDSNQLLIKTAKSAELRGEAELKVLQYKERLAQINYDIVRSDQILLDQANERKKAQQQAAQAREQAALDRAKDQMQIIPNAKSGLSKIKQGKELSSDQATAIAYLQQQSEELRNVETEAGMYSEQFTAELQKQLQLQSGITDKARQQVIARLQAQKAIAQQTRDQLKVNLISQDQYAKAQDTISKNKTLAPQAPVSLMPTMEQADSRSNQAELAAAQAIVEKYQQQADAREKVAQQDNIILGLLGQILLYSNQLDETEQVQSLSEKIAVFRQIADSLLTGDSLSDDQFSSFTIILDQLIEKYPDLIDEAELLKNTWLAGTDAYQQALNNVQSLLEQVFYDDLVEKADQGLDHLKQALENIEINIDSSDYENWMEDVQNFLDSEKELTIAVHSDAQNQFQRLSDQMDTLYNAASKIGQGFVVAADDLRELNSVFPGIIQGMQMLDDGSYQLNSNIVQRAIATAQTEINADAESVNARIGQQASLLHAKAATYRQMAEACRVLAGEEVDSEMDSDSARAVLSQGLAKIKETNSQLSSQQEMNNQKQVADSSDANAGIIASNFSSAASSSAESIFQFAQSAIENFHQIAIAAAAAMKGQQAGSAVGAGGVSNNYSGQSGQSSEASLLQGLSSALSSPTTSAGYYSDMASKLDALADATDQTANDMDAMKASTESQLDKLNKGLENVASGKGINGGSGKGGKGKGGGGGGGGSGSEKEPDVMQPLKEQLDRYHDIDLQLKKIEKDLDLIQNQQEKLFGRDLIDNLNKQIELLNDQVDAYHRKIDLAKQQKKQMQDSLKAQGVLFDSNTGAISNYAQVMGQKLAGVNAIIAHYNTLSAEQQKEYKDTVEAAKKQYEEFKKQIEKYDTLISDTIPDLQKSVIETRDKIVEAQIQKFNMQVEIELDLSQAKKDWNKFLKEVIYNVRDDDIYHNAIAGLQDFYAFYDEQDKENGGLVPTLTKKIQDDIAQINSINETGTSSIFGEDKAKALETLKNDLDSLQDSLISVEDIYKQILQSFYDMIDAADEAFGQQKKEFEFVGNLIQHDKKLIELLYGDEAYDQMSKYHAMQQDNDRAQIEFQRQQRDFWWQKMQESRVRLQGLTEGTNDYKQEQKRFEQLKHMWMDSVQDFNDKIQDAIDHLLDGYKEKVDSIFDEFGKNLTNKAGGLDYVSDEWELINKQADMYLDKVNSMTEIQNFQDAVKQAMEDNKDNVNAQEALNNLMKTQLAYLRGKDKLTKYDVDRANTLLQIEVKRLALQNARQSKSQLRLRRDSQGNYSYQYTADQSQINQAEKELRSAQSDLYNLDKDEYQNNLDSILETQQAFNKEMQQLYKEYPEWTEQAEQKRLLLTEKYGNIMNGLVAENNNIRKNLTQSAFDTLGQLYGEDAQKFKNMTDAEKQSMMKDLVPYWQNGVQSMADTFSSHGGLIPTYQPTFDALQKNSDQYKNKLDKLQASAKLSFDEIKNGQDANIEKGKSLLQINQNLIDTYEDEFSALEDVIKQVKVLQNEYLTAKQYAIDAATAANKLLVEQNKKASKAAADDQKGTSAESEDATPLVEESFDLEDESTSTDKKKKKSSSNKTGTASSEQVEGIAAAIWLDENSGWGDGTQRRQKLIEKFDAKTAEAVQAYINQHALSGDLYERWGDKQKALKKYRYSSFKTGGYTGDWNDNTGKIGILHEKEIVLNQNDTANILSAVSIVRSIDNLLNNLSGNIQLPEILSKLTPSNDYNSNLNQNVSITASFPAVNSRVEIESAFNNLINRASQYAFNSQI